MARFDVQLSFYRFRPAYATAGYGLGFARPLPSRPRVDRTRHLRDIHALQKLLAHQEISGLG